MRSPSRGQSYRRESKSGRAERPLWAGRRVPRVAARRRVKGSEADRREPCNHLLARAFRQAVVDVCDRHGLKCRGTWRGNSITAFMPVSAPRAHRHYPDSKTSLFRQALWTKQGLTLHPSGARPGFFEGRAWARPPTMLRQYIGAAGVENKWQAPRLYIPPNVGPVPAPGQWKSLTQGCHWRGMRGPFVPRPSPNFLEPRTQA